VNFVDGKLITPKTLWGRSQMTSLVGVFDVNISTTMLNDVNKEGMGYYPKNTPKYKIHHKAKMKNLLKLAPDEMKECLMFFCKCIQQFSLLFLLFYNYKN